MEHACSLVRSLACSSRVCEPENRRGRRGKEEKEKKKREEKKEKKNWINTIHMLKH